MDAATAHGLFRIGFAFYFSAFLGFSLRGAVPAAWVGWIAVALLLPGFALHTAGIVVCRIVLQHLPMHTVYEYLNLMSWLVVAVFGLLLLRPERRVALGILVLPAVVLMIVAASILPQEPAESMVPALRGTWRGTQIALTILAQAAFAAGSILAAAYVVCAQRRAGSDPHRASVRLLWLRETAGRCIVLGHPLFTVGALFSGSLWALQSQGSVWEWGARETSVLMIWLCYSGYLAALWTRAWRHERLAWIAIAGLVCLVSLWLGELSA